MKHLTARNSLTLAIILMTVNLAAARAAQDSPVTLTEDRSSYTLANGIVTARVSKRSGDLISLKYHGLELLGAGSGHPYGYWSHTPGRGMRETNSVTINPKLNGGERAEVSVKGLYEGGAAAPRLGGSVSEDIEIRYTLGRGESGIYTYSIFTHPSSYPYSVIGEARFGVKLNPDVFDYMTIDARRSRLMPRPEDWDKGTELNMKEARRLNTGLYAGLVEHKYDYSAIQFDTPAYGWSSTSNHVGIWFINPSMEYLSGGATKVELTGHLDNNEGALPTLLNYWRGSHYGGSSCVIGAGEEWKKVVGPFLIFCNSGSGPEQMWKDALKQAAREAEAWPYAWVRGADYPHKDERGTVDGRIILRDPQAPGAKMSNLLVGLAAPDYETPRFNRVAGGSADSGSGEEVEEEIQTNTNGRANRPRAGSAPRNNANPNGAGRSATRGRGSFGGPRIVDWQLDAKHYEFWVRGDSRGRFKIPNVRPGTYTLHVIADGVLGEAVRTDVTVAAGQTLDLGELAWIPTRFGRELWEIGIPDRSAAEFRHGDYYWQWGLYNDYDREFPHDVNFVIGKSDYHRDWNYAQVPRGRREGSTWSVIFNLAKAPHGRATLRLGIASASVRSGIEVKVNDQPADDTGPMTDTATIRRDGIRGYWSERAIPFDAALLKAGTNVLKLTIPGGSAFSGVQYDYLRLELNESFTLASSNPR